MFLVSLLISLSAQAAVSNSEVLGLLTQTKVDQVEVMRKQSKEFYPALIKVAFSDEHSVQVRWKALILAAQINVAGSAKDLEKASQSNDWFMKNAALVALKKTQPALAQKLAMKLISDKALVVRSEAVRVLPDNLEMKVRDLLWRELQAKYNFYNGESLVVRGQIVGKLALHPQKKEYRLFASAVKDEDESLHRSAVQALEKLTGAKLGNSKLWMEYINKHSDLN